jgi:hypothetical protein
MRASASAMQWPLGRKAHSMWVGNRRRYGGDKSGVGGFRSRELSTLRAQRRKKEGSARLGARGVTGWTPKALAQGKLVRVFRASADEGEANPRSTMAVRGWLHKLRWPSTALCIITFVVWWVTGFYYISKSDGTTFNAYAGGGVVGFVWYPEYAGFRPPPFPSFAVERIPFSMFSGKPFLKRFTRSGVTGIEVPFWLLCLPILLVTAVLWYLKPVVPAGHCRKCGYNLKGNVSGRCPECGMPVPQSKAPAGSRNAHSADARYPR